MPFPKQTARLYTRANVEALNPNQNGVYGLYNKSDWVYVGKSNDIRGRLLDHLNGDNPCIIREKPTHWVDVVIQGVPSAREQQLILELKPTCNKKVG